MTEEEQQEVFAGFLTVYDEVILPSLSLMPHNCCLSEEVWGFVRLLKYEHRSVVLIVTFSQVLLTIFTTPFSLNRFAVVMVALWNKADHYIFILWFLSFYLLFFPRLISAAALWMSTILPHMVFLTANFECRSEMCCTRLAENTGCKKVTRNRHMGTIAQLCRAISSQLRHISSIGKKTC